MFLYRSPTDRVTRASKVAGRLREMGLGTPPDVTLVMARSRAIEARSLLATGADPLDARKTKEGERRTPTFGEIADEVVSSLESGWRNEKHRAQWRSTLLTYCGPLRAKPVNEVETADVLAVLAPIWTEKAETASRVRGRIEKVLDAAKAKGHRSGENPARWRGHLDHLLARRQKLQRGHHPAMPWIELPAFVERLKASENLAARCLEFVILTACRSGEVLRSVRNGQIHGLRWEEVDHKVAVWTVPAIRMKAGKPHRVPLTVRAVEILAEMEAARRGPFVFPGQQGDMPLSEMGLEALLRRLKVKPYTVHGFRSTFSDWAYACTSFPREIVEAALAHAVGDAVERAYRRGDAVERRRELMEAWAAFCNAPTGVNVVPIGLHSSGERTGRRWST